MRKKKNFHGIVPGILAGILFLCFFYPIRNDPKKHINKFLPPNQSRDNPARLFMFVRFSFLIQIYGNFAKFHPQAIYLCWAGRRPRKLWILGQLAVPENFK